MKKILQSKIFWLIFVILSLAIFSVFLDTNRVYESKSDVLIVAKSELASENFDRIIENMVYIPHTLSFYDKIIGNSGTLDDNFKGLPSLERKLFWEREIETKRVAKSGIIKITISDPDKNRAEILNRKACITLASYLSQTYDIKTDIDVRIIDGPLTRPSVRYSFWELLLVSLLGGFVAALIFYWSFSKLLRLRSPRQNISLPVSLEKILKEKNRKPKDLVYEEESAAVQYAPSAPKAAAPDNLPIADEIASADIKPSSKKDREDTKNKEKISASDTQHTGGTKEPTSQQVQERLNKLTPKDPSPEEVKERLNKLLNGEF